MLKLEIPAVEFYDEVTNRFVESKATEISMEHSLVSISKWEAKWHKPFLGKYDKTEKELLHYLRCMTLTQNVDPEIYKYIITNRDVFDKIYSYMEDPATATSFKESQYPEFGRIITSEIIYYWMIQFGIPMECQKWHINRLLALVRVCSEKANPKKMGMNDIYKQNASLNALRRAAMRSKG